MPAGHGEALAVTRTEIGAVRLSATEQTKTHLYASVQASQRKPGWLMSLCMEKILGIAILLGRRQIRQGHLQI
jgi:hypothetical protein